MREFARTAIQFEWKLCGACVSHSLTNIQTVNKRLKYALMVRRRLLSFQPDGVHRSRTVDDFVFSVIRRRPHSRELIQGDSTIARVLAYSTVRRRFHRQ